MALSRSALSSSDSRCSFSRLSCRAGGRIRETHKKQNGTGLNSYIETRWAVFRERLTFSISAPSVSLSISCSKAATLWLIYGKRHRDVQLKRTKIQEFKHISGLVFSLELGEHAPLPALLASAPASSSSETPPAPHCSGAAAGFPPVIAAGTWLIVGSLCHPTCILLKIGLTVSAKTFLYVSQSFCRILWVSSASLSFSESAW